MTAPLAEALIVAAAAAATLSVFVVVGRRILAAIPGRGGPAEPTRR